MKVKEVEIPKEVIRSDGWWRFACGDVSSSSSSLHLPLSNSNSNFLLSYMAVWNIGTVYVHCRAEGYIGLYISNDQEISHVFRDVPRAKPKGHLEGQGKSWGQRGCTTQYIPIWGSVWPFSQSFIIDPTLGIYQEIHHYRTIDIGSVKINILLLMVRKCIPRPSGNLSASGDVFLNTSLLSAVYGYMKYITILTVLKSKKMYPSALGKSLGLGKCISQDIPPLGSVRIHYQPCCLVNTKNTSSMMTRECAMSCGIVRWDFRHFV